MAAESAEILPSFTTPENDDKSLSTESPGELLANVGSTSSYGPASTQNEPQEPELLLQTSSHCQREGRPKEEDNGGSQKLIRSPLRSNASVKKQRKTVNVIAGVINVMEPFEKRTALSDRQEVPAFYGIRRSLPCSQKPATGPYL
jgi:hypothetical protein